jgi:hypothetical protein
MSSTEISSNFAGAPISSSTWRGRLNHSGDRLLSHVPEESREYLSGFDYVGAYIHIVREAGNLSLDDHARKRLRNLCERILLAHGAPVEADDTRSDLQSLCLRTTELLRPSYSAALKVRLQAFDNSFSAGAGSMEVESGWEADVFLSSRRQHRKSVYKVYRFHFLGNNPAYPGFGWIADFERLPLAPSPDPDDLPCSVFVPAQSIDLLQRRFESLAGLPFWAKTIEIRRLKDLLCLEQERVAPVVKHFPGEVAQAARTFLIRNFGVYSSRREGDIQNGPVLETALISFRERFYIVQDYFGNLGYRLDADERPDQTCPVMFDGHIYQLTPRLMHLYPFFAHAVLLHGKTYSDQSNDELVTRLAHSILAGDRRNFPSDSTRWFSPIAPALEQAA